MPKYLFQANLNSDGVAGIIQEGGTARVGVVNSAIEALGGTVEAFYFAFGDADSVLIADLPDNEAATAFALDVAASGRVSVTTTVLVTPEEVDRAIAKRPGFRGPGA
ncbi:MAG: GYD domain-containing protein [Acidimicrobiia bacterium]